MSQFELTYRGEAVDAGTMDVQELAPALLAASGLARRAQALLHPDGPEISVRVVAHGKGSFEVHLALVGLVEQVKSFFASDAGEAVRNITVSIAALLNILKRLQGKPPIQVDDDPTSPTVVIQVDKVTLEVPRDAYRLYSDEKIRENVDRLTEPLEKDGYQEIEVRVEGQPEPVVIDKPSRPFFAAPRSAASIVTDETYTDTVSLHTIRTETPSWMVRGGDGKVINVRIADEVFWADYQSGRIPAIPGYLLRCEIHLLQVIDVDGRLDTTYSVVRVLDVLPPDAPIDIPTLLDPTGESGEEE